MTRRDMIIELNKFKYMRVIWFIVVNRPLLSDEVRVRFRYEVQGVWFRDIDEVLYMYTREI